MSRGTAAATTASNAIRNSGDLTRTNCELLILLAAVTFLPRLVYPWLSASELRGIADAATRITLQNARYQLQNDFRSELLQILAGLFVVAGAAATWRQIQIAREGQMTERFIKAIEHLGSDKLDIRLGGHLRSRATRAELAGR